MSANPIPPGGEPPPVDPRYVAAVKRQQAEKAQRTARRRPILRLVWVNPEEPAAYHAKLAARKAEAARAEEVSRRSEISDILGYGARGWARL
jgi:hypothetical protein